MIYPDCIVFPTRVGMDLYNESKSLNGYRIPHTRGDGPVLAVGSDIWLRYSPHAWGWTVRAESAVSDNTVFPTRVGMDQLPKLKKL